MKLVAPLVLALVLGCSSTTTGTGAAPPPQACAAFAGAWTITLVEPRLGGLGLPICPGLAKSHEWTVTIDDALAVWTEDDTNDETPSEIYRAAPIQTEDKRSCVGLKATKTFALEDGAEAVATYVINQDFSGVSSLLVSQAGEFQCQSVYSASLSR